MSDFNNEGEIKKALGKGFGTKEQQQVIPDHEKIKERVEAAKRAKQEKWKDAKDGKFDFPMK